MTWKIIHHAVVTLTPLPIGAHHTTLLLIVFLEQHVLQWFLPYKSYETLKSFSLGSARIHKSTVTQRSLLVHVMGSTTEMLLWYFRNMLSRWLNYLNALTLRPLKPWGTSSSDTSGFNCGGHWRRKKKQRARELLWIPHSSQGQHC